MGNWSATNICIFLHLCILRHFICAYQPIINKLKPEEIAQFEKRVNAKQNGHRTLLDYNGKYELEWEYDNDTITFEVNVEAGGWVGLGFTPSHGMTNADIVFIWIDADGHGQISDRHATSNSYPEKDHQQDYTLISATKNGSHFQARFRRKRETCDHDDYALTTTDNTRIIWAYSDEVPSDEDHFQKHRADHRGLRGVFLFEPPDIQIRLPSDTVTLDLLSDSTPLPTDYHLMYWCQIFQLPNWPVHHLIRLEAIIEKGHEQYVHHVALYQCSNNMSAYLGKGQRCFRGEGFNFSDVYQCTSKNVWFWNPGMASTDFPSHVGLPMFESPGDTYVMLEVHYENIELKPDIIDHSGLRLYLTRALRPIQAGVMYLGVPEKPPNMILPPSESDFHLYSHFENCMSYLPSTGVHLLYSLLHAHLYAKSIRMHHYRNGTQLADFAADDNYDFFSQDPCYQIYEKSSCSAFSYGVVLNNSMRQLNPPRLILPGDRLVLECVFNTSRTNKTVFGGYSTYDEMCDSTHYYYPRVAREFTCLTYPHPAVYVPMFGGQLDNDTVHFATNESVPLYQFVTSHLDWTIPGIRDRYKESVSNGQYKVEFNYQPLKNETNFNSTVDVPVQFRIMIQKGYAKVEHHWIAEVSKCLEGNKGKNEPIPAQHTKPLFLVERSFAQTPHVQWMMPVLFCIALINWNFMLA